MSFEDCRWLREIVVNWLSYFENVAEMYKFRYLCNPFDPVFRRFEGIK